MHVPHISKKIKMYKVSELKGYLPHYGNMEWIDEVHEFDDVRGVCLVYINATRLYCSNNMLRQSSCIEFIAQSFGFVTAANIKKKTGLVTPVDSAFLVGITKAKFCSTLVKANEIVLIETIKEREIGQIAFVKGIVRTKSGEIICEATLKLYSD